MSWKVRAEADGYDLSPLLRVCLCQKLQSCVLKSLRAVVACVAPALACKGPSGTAPPSACECGSHPLSLLVSL